jgi:hypothetical protein
LVSIDEAEAYLQLPIRDGAYAARRKSKNVGDEEMDWKSENPTNNNSKGVVTSVEQDMDNDHELSEESADDESEGSSDVATEDSEDETSEGSTEETSEESTEASKESEEQSDTTSDSESIASDDFEKGLALLKKNEAQARIASRRAEKMEDLELEELDEEFSRKEEKRLWHLLEQPDKFLKRKRLDEQEDEQEPDFSSDKETDSGYDDDMHEPGGWRDSMKYKPEWETYPRCKIAFRK